MSLQTGCESEVKTVPLGSANYNKQGTAIPFIINGCAVSVSSSAKGTDDLIVAVKEILLSAYRKRIAV